MNNLTKTDELEKPAAVAGQTEFSLLCGCGRPVRYSHFDNDRNEVMSCNKRVVCLTYDEQRNKLSELQGLYSELLYGVARKFPGESRHETAFRYIRAAEEMPSCESAKCEAT